MNDWNAKLYLKYENERTQPARDLAARIRQMNPKNIADLGCGPGNSTRVLKDRFPDASIVGIDSSESMIIKAKEMNPDINFILGDITSLTEKYDLLFSNACLQWIPNHKELIPTLMNQLNEGGCLAVQIPVNGEEPLFRLIKDMVADSKWNLTNVHAQPDEVLSSEDYYNILSTCSSDFTIWETKYYHSLDSHEALVGWVQGTRLRPYLAALNEIEQSQFLTEMTERSRKLYKVLNDRTVLLGFKRLFFIANK